MKRWLTLTLATVGCGLLVSPFASAQQGQLGQYTQPQWQSRPTLSPYLNMMRTGASPAINYYGLVRPQMNATQNLQNIQQQLQMLDNTVLNNQQGTTTGAPTAGSYLSTGHPVAFLNYGTYFPLNRGRIGGGGGGFGGIPIGGGVGLGAGGFGAGGIGAGGVGLGIIGNVGR